MRKCIKLMSGWTFRQPGRGPVTVDLPHTWNALDGQDGGDDYWRGTCTYTNRFCMPVFSSDERVYLQFHGVNASARVILNGQTVMTHDGGYSTFRCDVTDVLKPENGITVAVDNSVNDRVYPQKADFTFYGGIYRDVELLVVNRAHFDLDHFGGPGVEYSARVAGRDAAVDVTARINDHAKKCGAVVRSVLTDADGREIARAEGQEAQLEIANVHLWDGVDDPYLYRLTCTLLVNGEAVDRVYCNVGVRTFRVDPHKGFFLNGRSYPLRGVCRHQDWKGIGNALRREHHDADMALIREVGANTVRLAHYQHDQYFYDLCDKYGLVVWAEIPCISEHLPHGRENSISQMRELVAQNRHHPSIICWGVSNEITISTKDRRDMLENHRILNDICHEMDPGRLTTLACYALCSPFNPTAHITDVVSWNLYLGWYVPFMWLNDLWVDLFHTLYPRRCLGYSEYGCECMPNLHSARPRRGDQSEEYQCKYNEYMLRFFARRPFLWATHLWNMFDFAADARNQGGEPGMNHKGLVTFDRSVRKDSFYIYKAWWSREPFVHICGRRFADRVGRMATVKIYSNQPEVTLFCNGRKIAARRADKIFTFRIRLTGEMKLEARAGDCRDEIVIRRVSAANPAYRLKKGDGNGANWI